MMRYLSYKVIPILLVGYFYPSQSYHLPHHFIQPYRYENVPNVYMNFEDFEDSPRSNRKVRQFGNNPSNGFNWEVSSRPVRQGTFNGPNAQDDDALIFWDDSPDDRFNGLNNNGVNNNGFNNNNNNNGNFNDGFGNPNWVSSTTQRPRPTVPIPGMGTTRSACEDRCQTTPEYNPICADDNTTYFSMARLKCAQKCGKRISMKHAGACSLRPPRR